MIGDAFPDDPRWHLRFAFLFFLALGSAQLATAYVTHDGRQAIDAYAEQSDRPLAERRPLVGARENVTVATGKHGLYAFAADGRLLYYTGSRPHFDVDPSDRGRWSVLVASHSDPFKEGCHGICTRNYLDVIDLRTGERRTVYSATTPRYRNSNWHDADRVGPDEYLITGMVDDSVYRVNTTADQITWGWRVQSAFPLSSGGPYPDDFAHVNDVEQLPGGRIMVSLRNQDSVVFINETGIQPEWTLGCPDCFDVLYEQHNPDYIPESRGGPAVLVADSENNRIVEYQRVDGSWQQSWQWTSPELTWPRDADRLPNGHTLITDTHGDRIIEVDRQGEVVWEASVPVGYDAERLGTGDESAGGPSAVRANLTSAGSPTIDRFHATSLANEAEWSDWRRVVHGVQFYLPAWADFADLVVAVLVGIGLLAWAGVELYLRGWRLRRPVTKHNHV